MRKKMIIKFVVREIVIFLIISLLLSMVTSLKEVGHFITADESSLVWIAIVTVAAIATLVFDRRFNTGKRIPLSIAVFVIVLIVVKIAINILQNGITVNAPVELQTPLVLVVSSVLAFVLHLNDYNWGDEESEPDEQEELDNS